MLILEGAYIQEIERIKAYYSSINKSITDESAFEILILQYFFYKEKEIYLLNGKVDDHLTNGPNDGGIDLVYYDEDDEILSLVQCKTTNLSSDEIIDEFRKMHTTVQAFVNQNTGAYSDKLKRILQENLDRLPDNGQIEYHVFYLGNFDSNIFERKLKNSSISDLEDMINVSDLSMINTQISNIQDVTTKVSEFKADLDKAKNYLEYESAENYGVLVNISSNSLIRMYNKFKDKGLFDMNIRKFVPNKLVDNGIRKTLDSDRENFWFYNNGLIIACEDFEIDGNTIKIYNFSIVNGGQTTNLLGNYRGKNSQEFYIPCKVVFKKDNNKEKVNEFFTQIAETTNTQKPIKASDLKSNTPEMLTLRRALENHKIDFQIKRGERFRSNMIKIKNEEFGQLILSFVMQKPGTARSNKKALFENNSIYAAVYKKNYVASSQKMDFIVDMIKFYERYKRIVEEMKRDENLFELNAKDVLKNGTFIIFAIIGVLYRIHNNDIQSFKEAVDNPALLSENTFVFGKFISNYNADDLDDRIKKLIIELVLLIEERYTMLLENGEVTSVSNYFKTDKKYHEDLLKSISSKMLRERISKPIMEYSVFLKR
ncbi:AIPR family protein [Ureibacillus sp. FSL K6-0165]|uniref:AIPR family protein n=1 Tax=Ureibacillus sp. FSL K6-0165 TaxID=2954606 RepID=UPI0030F8E63B